MGGAAQSGWSTGTKIPEPLQEISAAVLNGKVYIAGGFNTKDDVTVVSYRFDPAAGRWDRLHDLPEARHHRPLVVVRDTLYAVGGFTPSGFQPVATLWRYDAAGDRWVERARLPEARGAGGAAGGGGTIPSVGGEGGGGHGLLPGARGPAGSRNIEKGSPPRPAPGHHATAGKPR